MPEVYIKTVNGGETTSPTGNEGLPLDDGTTSTWISLANIAEYIRTLTQTLTNKIIDASQLVNASVTYAKIQNVTDARLLGRSAGSAGAPQEITVGSGLSLSGGNLTGSGYSLAFYSSSFAPTDATTYYLGPAGGPVPTATAAIRRVYCGGAGTLSRVDITVLNDGGTQGSNETSTISMRLNNTTDIPLTSSFEVNNASGAMSVYNITGLSQAIAAGDYLEVKWVTPTWATNPTNVRIQIWAYIS